MNSTDTRQRGITLTLLDLDEIAASGLAQAQKDYPQENYTVCDPGFQPYAAAEIDGRLYVICGEGVGWLVTDDKPLVIGLYAERADTIAMMPRYQVSLSPAEVRELMTAETVDLADHIRVFGSRLEENFRLWHRTLNK